MPFFHIVTTFLVSLGIDVTQRQCEASIKMVGGGPHYGLDTWMEDCRGGFKRQRGGAPKAKGWIILRLLILAERLAYMEESVRNGF